MPKNNCTYIIMAANFCEVPIPTPNQGEVLVKLEAISLNPIDWKMQKGIYGAHFHQNISPTYLVLYSLGADEVLDYKTPDGVALKSPSGRKYDVVIHCEMDIPWSTFEPNLSTNGKVIDSKHPLSKAEEAWAKISDGHATGKIIVEPSVL
ncbi:hypothetical protein Golax_022762 [Gossypium laxum]|uniref:Uncharacterized protein n=1 Tax=Gossypium laxum TaxID=34288 RepID=A0A7J9B213_9ROSI|nr:hypothetical protein [Gossypium laxum]